MSRPLVLIADDDAQTAAGIARYLDLEGFECVTAGNGADALAVLATRVVAAALLDSGLAPPDGPAICRHLRTTAPGLALPVLIFATDDEQKAAALDAGASAVVAKPYHLAAIAAALRHLVPGVPPPRG